MYIFTVGKQVSENSASQNDKSQCICNKLYCDHVWKEQVRQVVDGIWCISPKFKPQIIQTVALMHIYTASKQVSGNSAGLIGNNQGICNKQYFGHVWKEQVRQVVDGIWCISPKFKPEIIQTVVSMYIFSAGKQVSGNSAGQNDKSQCICDKLYCCHLWKEQVRQVVDGIWCISPKFKP